MNLKTKFLFISFLFAATTKLDINEATISDLRKIPGVSPQLARSIIEYRAKIVKFKSIDELKEVPRMSRRMYEYLTQYLYVKEEKQKEEVSVPYEEEPMEESKSLDTGLTGAGEDVEALERYIEQPLNLNTAREEQLLELPMMTLQLARNIIEYRKKTPFEDVSELQNVSLMTREIYQAIRPYVTALPPEESFRGEFRFRTAHRPPRSTSTTGIFAQPPELQNPYYIYNRTRLFAGSKAEAGWLLLRRDGELAFTNENISRYFLRKYWIKVNDTPLFDRFVAGDFSILYGQGLVFYNNFTEAVRPVRIKPKGPVEDKSTYENSYLRGFAGVKNLGNIQLTFIFSDKNFDVLPLIRGTDTFINYDLMQIREIDGSMKDINTLNTNDRLNEKLTGGRIGFLTPRGNFGLSFYNAKYNPPLAFKSTKTTEGYVYNLDDYFMRGDENTLTGFDFDFRIGVMQISGEWARSSYGGYGYPYKTGDAFIVVPYFPFGSNVFYSRIWSYSTFFQNRLAKSITLGSDNDTRNEDGVEVGYQLKRKGLSILASIGVANVNGPAIDTSYDSLNDENTFSVKTILPYTAKNIYFELRKQIYKGLEFYYRLNQDHLKDWAWFENQKKHMWLDRIKSRNRFQLTYEPGRTARYRIRLDYNTYSYPELNQKYSGILAFGEVKYVITPELTVNSRLAFFETPFSDSKDPLKPFDFVYVSQLEPIWDGVLLTNTYPSVFELDETYRGRIFYLTLTQKLGRNLRLWLKYANKYFPFGSLRTAFTSTSSQTSKVIESTSEEFAVEINYRFGKMPSRRTPGKAVEKEVEKGLDTGGEGY